MKIYPEIFKANDIRGVYPREVNKEVGLQIGRAFYEFLRKGKKKPLTIVVGKDNRLSSDVLAEAIKKGIRMQGGDVIDIGLSTTPMFYFWGISFKTDGGVMITASHNPPEYNGFKLVREEAIPLLDVEIGDLKRIVLEKRISPEWSHRIERGQDKKIKKQILNEYIEFNLKFWDESKFSPLEIVVDTANAVCGTLIESLSKKLGKIKIHHLFPELDGRFPNHNPDPSVKENLKFLQEGVLRRRADFGVAFDGDGDRIIFIDETGKFIRGDLITALLAKIILRERKGEKILYEITSSKVVREIIEESGGIPIEARVGTSFIYEKMRKENLLFGGEISGHYYFREDNFSENPLSVLFKVIEEISQRKQSFSKIIQPLKRYVNSGVINFRMQKSKEMVEKVKEYFQNQPCKISTLDGVKAEFKDWWVLVRPSNTEPLLRLVVEAKDKKLLRKKVQEVKRIILGS